MQLNTTTALLTALISAVIGFGLAFYFEKMIVSFDGSTLKKTPLKWKEMTQGLSIFSF